MKIDFEDGGYIDVQVSPKPQHVFIIVAAKNASNPLETIINSAELTDDQLQELMKDFWPKPEEVKVEDPEKPKKKGKKS